MVYSKKINIHNLINFLCLFTLVSSFYFLVTGSMIGYAIYCLVGLIISTLSIKYFTLNRLLVLFIGFIFLLINYLYLEEISYGVAIYFIFGLTLATTFTKIGISKAIAISYSVVIYSYFLYLMFLSFASGINLNTDVFYSNSSNYISIYVITSVILLYFSKVKQSILWIALTLGLAVIFWSGSRSGILSYSLLLTYVLFKNTSVQKTLIRVITFVLTVYIAFNILDFSKTLDKFQRKGLSGDGREGILSCYIEHTSTLNFFIGNDSTVYECFPLGKANPHNSFISAHMYTGGFAFIIILLTIYSLYRSFKLRRYDLFVFLLVLIARGMTDVVYFFQPTDFIFWYLILKSYQKSSHTNYGF